MTTKICPTCGGELIDTFVSKTLKRFGREFIYHNIKAETCQNCGEIFLDGVTMVNIEKDIREKVGEKIAA